MPPSTPISTPPSTPRRHDPQAGEAQNTPHCMNRSFTLTDSLTPDLDQRLSATAPDNPADLSSYPRAPLWRHLLAMVYDLFLIIPLMMVTAGLLVWVYGPVETATQRAVPAWQQWALSFGALLAFFGVFWRQQGQTLGMQAWRVKLVAQVDPAKKVTWMQAVIRVTVACLPFLVALIPFRYFDINDAHVSVYLLSTLVATSGILWRFTNSSRHYLHDRLSGTELLQTPKRDKKKKH